MGKAMQAGRIKRWSKLAAIPVGVLASGAMVLGATHATVTASAWNNNNTIESGKWTKADVTSSKPNVAVVTVKDLKPSGPRDDADSFSKVTYTFAADPAMVPGSIGAVLMKNFIAKDAQGNVLSDAAKSELAKHLHIDFDIERKGDRASEYEVSHTLAEWIEAGSGGNSVVQEGLLLNKDKNKNQFDVQIGWYLDTAAPAAAQNNSVSFALGAQVDEERDR